MYFCKEIGIVLLILFIGCVFVSFFFTDPSDRLTPQEQEQWCYLLDSNGKILLELKPEEFFTTRSEGMLWFNITRQNGKKQRIDWCGDYFLSQGRQEFMKPQEQK